MEQQTYSKEARTRRQESSAPDAIALLKSQHREVEELFKQFEAAGSKTANQRQKIVEKLTTRLEAHAKIEEKFLYPVGREVDDDLTLEAIEEHNLVHFLVRKINAMDPDDESYTAKVTVLKEIVEHHVEEEENEYFPKLEEELSEEDLLEIGGEMEAKFKLLMDNPTRAQSHAAKK